MKDKEMCIRDSTKCLDIDPEMLYGLENVSEKIA